MLEEYEWRPCRVTSPYVKLAWCHVGILTSVVLKRWCWAGNQSLPCLDGDMVPLSKWKSSENEFETVV